jgi:hypothetical protein
MPDKSFTCLQTQDWSKDSYSRTYAFEADELRSMAFYCLVPAHEKYRDIPELKRFVPRATLWRLHRRRLLALLKKIKAGARRCLPWLAA